jgi:hypothetical protein
MVSLLLCVLPILYTATALAVLPVVVAVERTNAIGRSFSLFHGAFGPALARILTIGGIAVGVLFLFALISGIAGAAMGTVPAGARPGTTAIVPLGVEITFSVIQSVLIAGLSVVLVPLWVLTYADLRARKEPTTSDTIRADLGIA